MDCPTSPGLWYWIPDGAFKEEVVFVNSNLRSFLCIGSGETFDVGYFYFETWLGPVPSFSVTQDIQDKLENLSRVIHTMQSEINLALNQLKGEHCGDVVASTG